MARNTATHSKFHGKWIVKHPENPSIIIGSGDNKEEAERNAASYIDKHLPWKN